MNVPALDLEFSPSPWIRRGAALALLAAGVVLLGTVAAIESRLEQRVSQENERSNMLTSPPAAGSEGPTDPEVRERDWQGANRVLDDLEVPWDDLFSSVEGAGSSGLTLFSLTPDAHAHSLRIAGSAQSVDEVLAYVRRLGGQPGLADVNLVSYSVKEGHIQFLIGARWTLS